MCGTTEVQPILIDADRLTQMRDLISHRANLVKGARKLVEEAEEVSRQIADHRFQIVLEIDEATGADEESGIAAKKIAQTLPNVGIAVDEASGVPE